MPDQRQFTRLKVRYPVVFVWKDESGEHAGRGVTSNISAGGMLIITSNCPPVSSIIHCEMLLPSPEGESVVALEGSATGSVLRKQNNDGESGFAVRSSEFVVRYR
jgi:PilZ domain-containing protein